MFTFTSPQMGQLQDQADARYAMTEARHLAAYAPALEAVAGADGLRAAVHVGLASARRTGFTEGRHIRLLLELMTHFGSRFDTDPQYAWLHPWLDPAAVQGADERARMLFWHATLYLERAYGRQGIHGVGAALHASRLGLDALAAVGADPAAHAPGLIARLHPQRVPYLSRDTASKLIDHAFGEAPRLGLGGPAAGPLLLALMFGFGHGIAEDPLHPWVADVLARPGLDGEARTAALHARAQATLAILLEPVTEARR